MRSDIEEKTRRLQEEAVLLQMTKGCLHFEITTGVVRFSVVFRYIKETQTESFRIHFSREKKETCCSH